MPLILEETIGRARLLRLNRPEKKNALSRALLAELNAALDAAAADAGVNAVVLTGGDKLFCAGGDISELAQLPDVAEAYMNDYSSATWQRLTTFKKPLIAAVAGAALGGGCEIALSCDIVFADEEAFFGQPEVLIGAMPGGGATQRLSRAVGKSLAMEMCLTGRRLSAAEAQAAGLVSSLSPPGQVVADALACADKLGKLSLPLLCMIKESVSSADAGLADGMRLERRLFQASFALRDRQEGMRAFLEKRRPDFQHC